MKLEESFFWFEIENSKDQSLIELLENLNFNEAIEFIRKELKEDQQNYFKNKRNLAVTLLYTLHKKFNESALIELINEFNEICKNNDFWSYFFDNFKTREEGVVNRDTLKEFRDNIEKYVYEEFDNLSKLYPNKNIIEKLLSNFEFKSSDIVNKFIENDISRINKIIENLNSLNFSEDEELYEDQKDSISFYLDTLKEIFSKFEDINIHTITSISIASDEVAQTLKNVALKISHTNKDKKNSLKIFRIASQFAVSNTIKIDINKNIQLVKEDTEMEEILKYIKNQNIEKALNLINEFLKDKNTTEEGKKIVFEIKNKIETNQKLVQMNNNNTPFLFNLSGFGLMLYGDTRYITAFFIPICPISRHKIIKDSYGNEFFAGPKDLETFYEIWRIIFIIIVLAWYFG